MLDLTHRQRTVITTSSAVLDSAAGPQASTALRAFRLTRANRPARCGARMGISSVSVSHPPPKLRCVPISPSSRKSLRVVPLNPICAAPCCVIPVSACARQRGPSFWGTGVQPSPVAPHLIGPRAMPILAGPTKLSHGCAAVQSGSTAGTGAIDPNPNGSRATWRRAPSSRRRPARKRSRSPRPEQPWFHHGITHVAPAERRPCGLHRPFRFRGRPF